MSLTIFPPEILGLILDSAENSYLVIALWNAGDKILQSKISKCMTVLEIRDSNPKSKSRFPKLISCLSNLCKLSVDHYSGYLADSPAALHACLLHLPSSITDLTVSSAHAPSAFLNHAADGSIIKSTYPHGTSELYDWSTIMPSLESLKIADYVTGTSIEDRDFAGLPATLKRLHLPTFACPQDCMMQSLPQSITDLDLNLVLKMKPAGTLHCLPGLTRLSISKIPEESRSWTDALPRHLTSLNLSACTFVYVDLAALPPTLTELTGSMNLRGIELERYAILLPKLTRLHAPLIDWLVQNINVISRKITSLKLHQGDIKVHLFDPSWLPRNITELDLGAICFSAPLSIGPGLPESLTSLKVTPGCANIELSCLANLPSSITNLDLTISSEYNSLPDIDIKWPPRLQSLSLDVFRDDWFQQLPRCLTSLVVENDMEGDYNDPLLGLPPHLRLLKLFFSGSVPCNKSERSSALECLAQLIELETLSIGGLCFDPTIMASLSPSLRSLDLDVDESLSSSHFVDLPPRLRKLTLHTPNELEYAGTDYLNLTIIHVLE